MRLIDPFPLLIDLIEMQYTDGNPSMVLTKAGEQIWNAAIEVVVSNVKGQPIIDAEPVRHGRWENYPDCNWRKCSACKVEFEKAKFNVHAANFCHNCGAKMDGGE